MYVIEVLDTLCADAAGRSCQSGREVWHPERPVFFDRLLTHQLPLRYV